MCSILDAPGESYVREGTPCVEFFRNGWRINPLRSKLYWAVFCVPVCVEARLSPQQSMDPCAQVRTHITSPDRHFDRTRKDWVSGRSQYSGTRVTVPETLRYRGQCSLFAKVSTPPGPLRTPFYLLDRYTLSNRGLGTPAGSFHIVIPHYEGNSRPIPVEAGERWNGIIRQGLWDEGDPGVWRPDPI